MEDPILLDRMSNDRPDHCLARVIVDEFLIFISFE